MIKTVRTNTLSFKILTAHALSGAFLSYVSLRLISLLVYWIELKHERVDSRFLEFVLEVHENFSWEMFWLSLLMAVMGGFVGLLTGFYTLGIVKREAKLLRMSRRLSEETGQLISVGENEQIEFKSSIRWDLHQNKVNRALEGVIIKTLAGLLNNQGGSLIIGVNDAGEVVGIEHDYRTLAAKDRDGFAQLIMSLVRTSIGADVCPLIYPLFDTIDGKDVCRVLVEPSHRPVFVKETNNQSCFYLRTGNGTSPLDTREALQYVPERWPNCLAGGKGSVL